jgi:hypothetical protein
MGERMRVGQLRPSKMVGGCRCGHLSPVAGTQGPRSLSRRGCAVPLPKTPAHREEEPAVGLRLPTTGSKREETVAAAPTLLLDAQGRSRRFGCLPQPGERVKEEEEPLDG